MNVDKGITNYGHMDVSGIVSAGDRNRITQNRETPPSAGAERLAEAASRWDSGPGLAGGAVVITALECEYRAVAEHMEGPFGERSAGGTLYRTGTVRGAARSRRVALARIGQGNVGAAVHVERARTALDPELILFLGIAGGLKDVRMGDVVVADTVYDYESGKEEQDAYLPRIKTAAPSHAAVQRAMDTAFRQEWQERILDPVPGLHPRGFVKPIAAGGKVVAHERARSAERIRAYCGDAVALEMEGYGVLHGAYLNGDSTVLVVRGISDMLTGKDAASDEAWQPVAARSAAAFACAFLDLFTPDQG
ncbi:phosphorylase [Streptomonospora salina]|uniref:Nucleoside phosphorylase n=1 Tax=Streptomonospora salina TaxID=104205 RepID=A0A841DZW2_9ACTN|nr:phosphorylase [Streptomonospora salina]MBB5997017.1 nucleoside phosphorylase [Streptomonospora salina]